MIIENHQLKFDIITGLAKKKLKEAYKEKYKRK